MYKISAQPKAKLHTEPAPISVDPDIMLHCRGPISVKQRCNWIDRFFVGSKGKQRLDTVAIRDWFCEAYMGNGLICIAANSTDEGSFFRWTGTHWEMLPDAYVAHDLDTIFLSPYRTSEMVTMIRRRVWRKRDILDSNGNRLYLRNAVLEIRHNAGAGGQTIQHPHVREDYNTYFIDLDYDPANTTCRAWDLFLRPASMPRRSIAWRAIRWLNGLRRDWNSTRGMPSLRSRPMMTFSISAMRGRIPIIYPCGMKRPGLDAMMEFARQSKQIHAVIAWERNRLARPKDPMDGMMLERELLASGKKVVYAATGQEAGTSFASGLMSYVEHHQSGDYLRKLSRDTMRGHIHRAERGLWSGGPIPFGYDRLILNADGSPKRIVRDLADRSQRILEANSGEMIEHVTDGHRYCKQDFELCSLIPSEPVRVQAVQKMFADYAAGAPIRVLRDELNRSGIRTGRGRIFTPATIHAMLENHTYIGDCIYNKRTESKWHRHTSAGSMERQDEGLEDRPECDWITTPNAWAAIIERDIFAKVQMRRKESHDKHRHVSGPAIRSEYILTNVAVCGVCGSRLTGQTTTSGKGYRTRYYICSAHHRGDHALCPKRYKVPALLLEQHIIGLIKDDLGRLRDDEKLHEYIAEELGRVRGGQSNAREQLQRRLAELDQAAAKLRDHLKALDPAVAQGLGLYDEAKNLMDERAIVERDIAQLPPSIPALPAAAVLRVNAERAFDELDKVLAGGPIEQRRELIGLYVEKIKADPDLGSVQISLYSALFSRVVAGARYARCRQSVSSVRRFAVLSAQAVFWVHFQAAA